MRQFLHRFSQVLTFEPRGFVDFVHLSTFVFVNVFLVPLFFCLLFISSYFQPFLAVFLLISLIFIQLVIVLLSLFIDFFLLILFSFAFLLFISMFVIFLIILFIIISLFPVFFQKIFIAIPMIIFLIFQFPTNSVTVLLTITLSASTSPSKSPSQPQPVASSPPTSLPWFIFSIQSDPANSSVLIPSFSKLHLISISSQLIFTNFPNLIMFVFVHFILLICVPFLQDLLTGVLVLFLVPCYILLSFLLIRSFFSKILLLFVWFFIVFLSLFPSLFFQLFFVFPHKLPCLLA